MNNGGASTFSALRDEFGSGVAEPDGEMIIGHGFLSVSHWHGFAGEGQYGGEETVALDKVAALVHGRKSKFIDVTYPLYVTPSRRVSIV